MLKKKAPFRFFGFGEVPATTAKLFIPPEKVKHKQGLTVRSYIFITPITLGLTTSILQQLVH